MKATLFTKTGGKSEKTITLPKDIFESEVNKVLLDKALKVYLANQRQSNAHSKTRGDVSGGGKKPWKQKGTGRARSGSIRNPIFRGGGVAFGPKNWANHKLTMNRKERAVAMRSALTTKATDKVVHIFEGFGLKDEKLTQTLADIFKKAKIDGKTLIVTHAKDDNIIKASSNLAIVDTEVVNSLNAYQILKYKNIVLTPETVEKIKEYWSDKKSEK
jgi:large subunit ribosomal protein L4